MKTKYLGKTNTNKPKGFKILDPIPRNKISKRESLINGIAKQVKVLDAAIQQSARCKKIEQ